MLFRSSEEELIAKLIGSMNAPLTNLVRVLGQVSEKVEDAKPEACEEPAKAEVNEEAPAEKVAESETAGEGEEAKEDEAE